VTDGGRSAQGLGGVALDRDHQLGEVAVADDPPELRLGDLRDFVQPRRSYLGFHHHCAIVTAAHGFR